MLQNDTVLTESPLYSREAEEGTLGSCLINPEVIPLVRGVVNRPDDFFIHRNRWIFDAICHLADKREPVDVYTVQFALGDKLAEIGGPAYLTGLISQVPTSLNAEAYAKQVHDLGTRRQLRQAADAIANYASTLPLEEAVTKSIEVVHLASNGLIGGRGQTAQQLAGEHYDRTVELAKSGRLPGIPTGLRDLDTKLGGGMKGGQLIVVSGFQGGGKSSFLEGVAVEVAKSRYVDFYSLEMTNGEQANRMMAQLSGINSQALDAGTLSENEWTTYTQAVETFGNLKLRIDDTAPLSIATLRAKCVQHKAMGQLDLVVVDYAGLMSTTGDGETEQARILSRDLKLLASELETVPVLVAVQLNREAAKSEKPTMHQLRGGSWESNADIIWLLSKSDNKITNGHMSYDLDMAKHRHGPTAKLKLVFEGGTTRFKPGTWEQE